MRKDYEEEKKKRLMRKDVFVYGKKGCGKCEAAKEKLELMGVPYEFRKMKDVLDGKIPDKEALVRYALADQELPILVIYGKGYTYPEAMKVLKGVPLDEI